MMKPSTINVGSTDLRFECGIVVDDNVRHTVDHDAITITDQRILVAAIVNGELHIGLFYNEDSNLTPDLEDA